MNNGPDLSVFLLTDEADTILACLGFPICLERVWLSIASRAGLELTLRLPWNSVGHHASTVYVSWLVFISFFC